MFVMLAKKEAATRHRPIAHGRDASFENGRGRRIDTRPPSETRLQVTRVAALVADKRDDDDPYFDVPCTD